MYKNRSGQKIGAQLCSAADGSAFTGAVTVYVTGNAGTQAIGSVGSGACTHEGNGYHTYAPSQAETNYELIAFTFIASGAVPVTVQVYPNTYVSAEIVSEPHVWRFAHSQQMTSPRYIVETIGFAGVLAMHFENALNPNQTLATVDGVTITPFDVADTAPTVVSQSVSTDKLYVHVEIDCAAATAGSYTVEIVGTSSDGYELSRRGTLVLE